MAVNPDSLQQRVINTYRLLLSQLTKNEIPEEIKEDFQNIKDFFLKTDPKMDAEEFYDNLAISMSNEQAKLIADKTISMRHTVMHY